MPRLIPILVGALLSWTSQAVLAGFPPLGPDDVVVWTKTASKNYTSESGPGSSPEETMRPQAEAYRENCERNHPDKICVVQSFSDAPEVRFVDQGITYYRWNGGARMVAKSDTCELLNHEPHPETGEAPAACSCQPGWIDTGNTNGIQCQVQEDKEACAENGEYFEQGGYCVAECASGSSLGSICLDNPNSECTSDSDDYVGSIGFGGNKASVCGDNQCPNGGDYAFKQDSDGNYQAQCLPNDANPPECPQGTAVVIGSDNVSFQCNEISYDDPDNPDDPNNPDGSDGDSDGDGEGDITGITGQLNDIKKLLGKGNTNTTNINETLKGIGNSIKDGTQSITDAIGNIPGGGGGGGNDGGGDGDGDGETPDPVTWNGDPIDTELTDPTDDYDQVMADYQAKINEIKGEVQAMFSTNLTGGGSVDDNTKTIMGVDVNFSLNRFLSGLDILGAIVLFCAAFISAGILFTSRG
ncbi:hypothetical protein [Marinobacter algicola]|uniref:hypothetical protein n=1 Tax=Marinobacter algicola TaxID=236100 RepID=UPI003BAAEBF0